MQYPLSLSVYLHMIISSTAAAFKLFSVSPNLYACQRANLSYREVISSSGGKKVAALIKCRLKAFVYFNGFSFLGSGSSFNGCCFLVTGVILWIRGRFGESPACLH